MRPARAASSVAAWLVQYPLITVVCRDRRDLYAEGIRRGAPAAVPVVDRLHLVHHLRHALEALLIDHRAAWQAAAIGTAPALLPLRSPEPVTRLYQGRRQSSTKGQLRTEAATRAPPRPARRGLSGGPRAPRPGHAHRGHGPRPRHQPPARLRLPAARPAASPQTAAVAAISAGVAAICALPDPPLAGEVG
jgi:Transposase